mgnify:CR=1 FL=1
MTAKERAYKRFMKNHDESGGIDSCWEWSGYQDKDGYGRMRPGFGKNYWGAHRYAYMKFVGPIPEGIMVLHECDNPSCVNPRHLFLGTNRDNVDDMMQKGRVRYGEAIFKAKLNASKVIEIRKLIILKEESQVAIGRRFGVSKTVIGMIARGKLWRHVPTQPDVELGSNSHNEPMVTVRQCILYVLEEYGPLYPSEIRSKVDHLYGKVVPIGTHSSQVSKLKQDREILHLETGRYDLAGWRVFSVDVILGVVSEAHVIGCT